MKENEKTRTPWRGCRAAPDSNADMYDIGRAEVWNSLPSNVLILVLDRSLEVQRALCLPFISELRLISRMKLAPIS